MSVPGIILWKQLCTAVTVPSNDTQEEECAGGKSLEKIKKRGLGIL